MPNIFKGFLNPKADPYVFPEAKSIEMADLPLFDEEEGEAAGGALQEELTAPAAPPSEGFDVREEEPETGEEAVSAPPPAPDSGEPVRYAQLQAELILKEAREEAESVLARARETAQQELEDIRAGARDEGYREGYAQGAARAVEDAIRDREAVAQRLEEEVRAFLEKATLAKEEMLLQTRDEMLDLCIAVAEKVVRVSLRSSSEVIVRMIQTATERLKRQEWVHIYISGCDARGAAQITPALTTALGALSQHIKLIPMGDGEDGTCIIETPEEIIDASVSTQMSNIRDLLRDQMGMRF
ncbi:MAG: F0F1 ATP synthase subunit delta [Oscillospiraceae bacterium]|nr:F0F1 ATP synthase subunit delta [Oscillospiraceae bacterium]